MRVVNGFTFQSLLCAAFFATSSTAFSLSSLETAKVRVHQKKNPSCTALKSATTVTDGDLTASVNELKKILNREYTTFFNPMYTEYYSPDVVFEDPMTSLAGVSQYQNNVDMLASRTLMGKVLFSDAGISLHSVTGGEISESGEISDIITRWTLRLTAKVLPWSPTARFSGISVYKVKPFPSPGKPKVQIVGQTDYWDSINIDPTNKSGNYVKVDKGIAIKDFLNQLSPGGFEAKQSAPELPYQLLRRGDGYEIRRYPAYANVKLPYARRDEGFGSLGAFTAGMNPLAPAILEVPDSDTENKYMSWPVAYAPPTSSTDEDSVPIPPAAIEKAGEGQWRTVTVETIPSQVVAIGFYSDFAMGPIVRKADRDLRQMLERDGLKPKEGTDDQVKFAQYDAIYSMGKRRGEVWIPLADDGHPW